MYYKSGERYIFSPRSPFQYAEAVNDDPVFLNDGDECTLVNFGNSSFGSAIIIVKAKDHMFQVFDGQLQPIRRKPFPVYAKIFRREPANNGYTLQLDNGDYKTVFTQNPVPVKCGDIVKISKEFPGLSNILKQEYR